MAHTQATPEGSIPLTPEEEAELEERRAAWAAGANDRLAAVARKQRDEILMQSDWRVTRASEAGIALSEEWAAYRQALRDVPQQSGFPTNINWPVAPGGA